MTIRSFAEVGVRLEKAVEALPGEAANPADLYDRYEMLATAILDSEFENYEYGMLEEYLMTYLYLKRLELNIPLDCEE
jgi:hypothetical protein